LAKPFSPREKVGNEEAPLLKPFSPRENVGNEEAQLLKPFSPREKGGDEGKFYHSFFQISIVRSP
jgi:hypothetical protein